MPSRAVPPAAGKEPLLDLSLLFLLLGAAAFFARQRLLRAWPFAHLATPGEAEFVATAALGADVAAVAPDDSPETIRRLRARYGDDDAPAHGAESEPAKPVILI